MPTSATRYNVHGAGGRQSPAPPSQRRNLIDWRKEIVEHGATVPDPENPPYCFWCGEEDKGNNYTGWGKVEHARDCIYRLAVEAVEAGDA